MLWMQGRNRSTAAARTKQHARCHSAPRSVPMQPLLSQCPAISDQVIHFRDYEDEKPLFATLDVVRIAVALIARDTYAMPLNIASSCASPSLLA